MRAEHAALFFGAYYVRLVGPDHHTNLGDERTKQEQPHCILLT